MKEPALMFYDFFVFVGFNAFLQLQKSMWSAFDMVNFKTKLFILINDIYVYNSIYEKLSLHAL